MAFVDELTIQLKAGRGGDGVVRWRTEKFKPKSGPGGGNGGRGGDVIIEGISDLAYLDHYRYTKDLTAENGNPGDNFGCVGKGGDDLILKLPVGVTLTNKNTLEEFTITKIGERVKVLIGGRGGLGNEHFKNSRNTTPIESTPGRDGETGLFHIELKLMADVGFVGFPSAGKSSLLNAITNASSKVGAYHFTTLDPHLGVIPHTHIILADIPGIIEGAHEGKGLGVKFLKHIERTKTLLFLLDGTSLYPVNDFDILRNELIEYNKTLGNKDYMIVISKDDEIDEVRKAEIKHEVTMKTGKEPYFVSIYNDELLKSFIEVLKNTIE